MELDPPLEWYFYTNLKTVWKVQYEGSGSAAMTQRLHSSVLHSRVKTKT